VTELAADDTIWKPAGAEGDPFVAVRSAATIGRAATTATRTIATAAALSSIRNRFPPGVSGVYAGASRLRQPCVAD
jgi:hypothetical protein